MTPHTERRIPLDLSSAPHLNDLTIRTDVFIQSVIPSNYRCIFPAIIHLLQTTPYLNNLTLTFYIYCGFSSDSDYPNFDLVDWSPFFSLFSSGKFRHIGLHFNLKFSTGHAIASANTLPRLYRSEVISDMMAKGILDISTTEESVKIVNLGFPHLDYKFT